MTKLNLANKLVHYIEFFYPRKTSTKEIKNRNSKFKISKDCFGYRFFDEIEGDFSLSKTFGPINFSRNIYFGKVITFGYQKFVKTKSGRYISLNPKNKVVSNL